MPGYVAGASLVFVKVFDDLATPLLLNVKDMLAPQAYLRVTSIGIADPMGYVIAVVLIVVSVLAMWVVGAGADGRKDYATVQRGGGGLARRTHAAMGKRRSPMRSSCLILALVLAPHLGLLLLSFATVWSFSPLPDAFTLAHYARVFGDSSVYIKNTLIYASLAGAHRRRARRRHRLSRAAHASSSAASGSTGPRRRRSRFRASCSASAICAPSTACSCRTGGRSRRLWIMIVLALAIRRLPYALRACHAALQQISVSLEEAAENLGATKMRTVRRVVVPLMMGGILAGFVSSFATAAVELSATLMLVQSNSDAPLAYGLYVFMQSPAGRGPGAALGVIAVVLVAICTFLSHLVIERSQRAGRDTLRVGNR